MPAQTSRPRHHIHPQPASMRRRRNRAPRSRWLSVAAILILLVLGHAALASASTYDVSICSVPGAGAGSDDGITVVDTGGTDGYMNTVDMCSYAGGSIAQHAFLPNSNYSTFTWNGDGTATIAAPPGTTLQSITMQAAFSGFQSWFTWDVNAPGGRLLDRYATWSGAAASWSGTRTYQVNSSSVGLHFYCALSSCGGSGTSVSLSAITPRISDTSAPSFSSPPSGSLLAGGPLRGSKGVSFAASDVGGGIYEVGLLVDGQPEQLQTPDSNGGRCVKPFQYLVPCPLSLSSSFSIDTTRIPDGQHEVQVVAYDATEEGRAVSAPTTIDVHNAPTSTQRPQLSGTPRLGAGLAASAGSWLGSPTRYAYAWLRCPASATSPADADGCSVIAGATSATYTPGADDAYHRDMAQVTATNASGSGSDVSAPSDIVADAQGRTSPPAPDPGGSRDVIVVPVAPGPAGGSSTTIINQPAPGGGTSAIAGLVNPVAGPGHVANGTNASDGARIQIAFRTSSTKQVSVVRSTRNRRWVIAGRLLNAAGVPVGSGELVAAWQVNGRWTAHTGVRTRGDGRFTYILAKGPTRLVKFAFYAYSDSRTYSESNAIAEKVATPVTLVVRPHVTRTNGRSITFSGTVAPDFIPPDGVLVVLEASYPGSGWKKFQLVRAHRSGRFTASYRFSQTRQVTRYRLRAVAEKQADYPFEGGTSRPSEVLVTP